MGEKIRLMAGEMFALAKIANVSHCGQSAVNHHHLSGHKRRLLRSQIQRHAADFLGLTDAMNRLGGFELTAACFILPEISAEVRLNEARRNGNEIVSACQVSTASMIADAFAADRVTPLP